MKTKNTIIVLSTLAYSYLFYNQLPGVNALLFTLILLTGLCILNKNLLNKTTGKLLVAGSILSAAAVALYGSPQAFLILLASLSLVSIHAIVQPSLIAGGLHAAYSYLISWRTVFQDCMGNGEKDEKSNQFFTKLIILGIPVLVTILFFFLYRASNTVFYNFTKNLSFDFSVFNLIIFTLIGFFLIYGFYKPQILTVIQNIDDSLKADIEKTASPNSLFGKLSSLEHENLSGIVLLVLLNFLILFVNILDSSYLLFDVGTKDINLSADVHQGVGTLILSILMAIGIILFFLRGQLNFYKSKILIRLAYIWIIQNIVLVGTTAIKNGKYAHEYGLTSLRIGVYIILILSAIGLILTFIKVAKAKTAWYLLCSNAWALYGVLLASTFFNWGAIITSFNRNWSIENNKHLDIIYLVKSFENNIPGLLNMSKELPTLNANEEEKKEFLLRFKKRCRFFKTCYKYTDWQSLNYEQYKTELALQESE